MDRITTTKEQACRFLLRYHCLYPPHRLKSKSDIVKYITRVGCIQDDPLNIVGYNHELVMQARTAGFTPQMLQDLLYKDRALIDGWDKNMSLYSVKDWPFFDRSRKAARYLLRNVDRLILPQVRREIEQRGPLSSTDLDYNQIVPWLPGPTRLSKAALESMFYCGELIVHHRINTRRMYDFARRYIPPELLQSPDPNITEEQYHDWYVERRIGGVGLLWNKSGEAWAGIPRVNSVERSKAIARLCKRGKIAEVKIEGVSTPFYIKSGDRAALEKIQRLNISPSTAVLLAPLDNLLWDRKMVKVLFDFDYAWEVYKPVTKRKYGYYVLPVLYGDRFIARFEPGKDQKTRTLLIKNWWWEPGIKAEEDVKKALTACFDKFLRYLDFINLTINRAVAKREKLDWLSHEVSIHDRKADSSSK